jgi:DNA invertase Pin-like site-specific DNA recombinase
LHFFARKWEVPKKGDSQQAAITQWLTSHGHDLAQVRWYTDTETGRTLQRKGFQTLQADIFRGEVKTVVVWKLDRLARSLREGVNVLADWCQRDVRVVSITQQIDLSGAVGQMIASLLFGIAEIEHQHIKERQAAGIAVAKAKGKYKGRQKGTTKAKPERARTLHAKGLTPQEIATALNVSERTVFRYLTGNDP